MIVSAEVHFHMTAGAPCPLVTCSRQVANVKQKKKHYNNLSVVQSRPSFDSCKSLFDIHRVNKKSNDN